MGRKFSYLAATALTAGLYGFMLTGGEKSLKNAESSSSIGGVYGEYGLKTGKEKSEDVYPTKKSGINKRGQQWNVEIFRGNECASRQYTAESVRELTNRVYKDLKINGELENVVFEASAILGDDDKYNGIGPSADVIIGSAAFNLDDDRFFSDSKIVSVGTDKGAGVYLISKIERGKIKGADKMREIGSVDLPENTSPECLAELAKSIACEAGLALLETGFEYARGEEKISPIKPGFDFIKDVGSETIKNITERYTPEEIEAVRKLIDYAEEAEDIYDKLSGKSNIIDLSRAVKALGLEAILDKLEEVSLSPLDDRCQEIAEDVRKSCSYAFKKYNGSDINSQVEQEKEREDDDKARREAEEAERNYQREKEIERERQLEQERRERAEREAREAREREEMLKQQRENARREVEEARAETRAAVREAREASEGGGEAESGGGPIEIIIDNPRISED